jgi:hypothetical protein
MPPDDVTFLTFATSSCHLISCLDTQYIPERFTEDIGSNQIAFSGEFH